MLFSVAKAVKFFFFNFNTKPSFQIECDEAMFQFHIRKYVGS